MTVDVIAVVLGVLYFLVVTLCILSRYALPDDTRDRWLRRLPWLPPVTAARLEAEERIASTARSNPVPSESAISAKREAVLLYLIPFCKTLTKHHFSSEESLLESVVNGRNVQQSQEIRPATCDEGVDDLEANTASSEPQLPVGDHSVAAHEVYSQTSNVQSVTRRNFSVIEIVDLPSTNKCAICLEPYHIGDTVTWSSNSCCSHYFHQGCIADWIMQQWIKRQHLFNSIRSDAAKNEEFMESVGCPCCRQKFIAMKNEAIEVIDESDGDCEQMSTASAGSNGLVLYPTRSDIGSSSTIHNGANNNDEA